MKRGTVIHLINSAGQSLDYNVWYVRGLWFLFHSWVLVFPSIHLLKVDNRNTRTRCEMCSKLTKKTPERRQWFRSGVFKILEHISHLALPSVSIVNFEHVISG